LQSARIYDSQVEKENDSDDTEDAAVHNIEQDSEEEEEQEEEEAEEEEEEQIEQPEERGQLEAQQGMVVSSLDSMCYNCCRLWLAGFHVL
jgi:hypothetical protein